MREKANEKPAIRAVEGSDQDPRPIYRKPQVEERGKLLPYLVAGSGPPLPP